jgi:hypothetical protein
MRSMIFREGMTNDPIVAVLSPAHGRTACWTLFRKHPDDLQRRTSRRRIATTFSIAELTKRALAQPFGRHPKPSFPAS